MTLRKNRHKNELFKRRSIFLIDRERHQICPFKLKGIPEQILEKFRINVNDLDNSIKGAMNYLNSKELNEIKFGAFILRRFFMELAQLDSKLHEQNQRLDFTIDAFLENNMIEIIGKVLTIESNIDIIAELTWALVNITYFNAESGNDYLKKFMNKTYMDIYYKLVKMGDNEILSNLYDYLVNCIIESDEFAKFIFADENFIRLCLMKYLEQNKPVKNFEQEAKKSTILFFISLSKLANILTEKQVNTFYKIYEKFLGIKFDSEILLNIIGGIRFLFTSRPSKEKIVFNLIKASNYDIFNKLFISFNDMFKKEKKFSEDSAIYNIEKIITHFISLAEEKDVIILVRNTQLINFIDFFVQKLYFKNNRNLLWGIVVNLSHHTSNVVLNMIQDKDDFLKTIKNCMNDKDFDVKMKCIEIVYSMLSLISLDINLILYKNEIIENLIKVNLPFEEEKTCLKYILCSILYFINSIKPLESKWKIELINNLIQMGIVNGFDNIPDRFNEEHIQIINQINSEMKLILNNEQEKNGIKVNDSQINGDNINLLSSHNPFMIFNKTYNEKNIIQEENNNENIQNNQNPFFN